MSGLLRHIEAVRNVTLPGAYLPFALAGVPVGWLTATAADRLLALGCRKEAGGAALDDAAALAPLAARLAEEGEFPHRGEAFDVRAAPGGPVLGRLDRGALPWFGVAAEGVHVNGLVERPPERDVASLPNDGLPIDGLPIDGLAVDGRPISGLHVWVGRRNQNRLMDPGKLDHITAGGIPAGMDAAATLEKEGAEEAGLPGDIMRGAVPASLVSYTMHRAEGLRRDRLHCYDLVLPEGVRPEPRDDEVAAFELWPVERVVQTVRDTDDFKFNVAVVLIDLFLRRDCLPDRGEAAQLRAAMHNLRFAP